MSSLAQVRRICSFGEADKPHWLQHVCDMLSWHFRENITLSQVSEVVDLHPVYVSRVFRKHFGCSITEYVRALRTDYACHELQHSTISLSEIAANAGFSDQSHFTSTIKRRTGLTPARYRLKNRPLR